MACEQSVKCCQVKRFAVTAVDDCVKVPCCKPVCKNPCLCNHVSSCCDCGCKSNCKKGACCIKACNKSCNCVPPFACKDDCKKKACSDPCDFIPSCCDYDCKPVAFKNVTGDCKDVPQCANKEGCFPVIKLDSGHPKEAFCEQVCERSTLTSYQDFKNDVIRNVTGRDCKGTQPCGHKMTGRFPVVKLDSDGPCCQLTHARAMDNML